MANNGQPNKDEFAEVIRLLKGRLDQIQEECPETTDDYKRLFLYFIGEQFEGISIDKIKICDAQGDQKIDFYDDKEDKFVAYQCKLGELEIIEKEGIVKSYDDSVINEVEDILTFLIDETGKATGNEHSQEARNKYRARKQIAEEESSIYKLEVVLAIFGRLTGPAKDRLEELKKNWHSNEGKFEIKVVNYDTVASELSLSLISKERPEKIKLEFIQEFHTNNMGYILVPAKEFYDLFEKHKMALFDLNVRYYLHRSTVNRSIMKTLNETQGIKNFHLLNNGITISCLGFKFPKNPNDNILTLNHPQIINGCQTVISAYKAVKGYDEEHKRRHFNEKCIFPVKVVLTHKGDTDLLEEIVLASNNQNKMSDRNLRSNTRVQRILQRKFASLKNKWFYERKDGEFESSRKFTPKWFKERDFKYGSGRTTFRQISNEYLAKIWLSFIGLSKNASENIKAFEIEEGGNYEWLFEKRPDKNHWRKITLGPQVELDDENFEPYSPSPEHYLLSYLIFEFVRTSLPSPQKNKKEAMERLKQSGKIDDNTSPETIGTFLNDDDNYVLNQILYNMKEVIIELYAWILIKTYGELDDDTVKKILKLPGFKDLVESPDFKRYVEKLKEKDFDKKEHILYTCFEFVKEAIMRWKSVKTEEYLRQQRKTRFLHSAKTIQEMKKFMTEANTATADFAYKWKEPGKEFLQSLPDIEAVAQQSALF